MRGAWLIQWLRAMPELSVRLMEGVLDATTTADDLSPALLRNVERLETAPSLTGDDPGAAAAAPALPWASSWP